MFDRAIIDTDRFMDLPMSAKALYFLLGMEADDEGFVSYKKIQRIHGGTDDDVKILTAKKFLIMFESGVVVITDWNTNNYLDKNRIRETEYQKEKRQLLLTSKGKYELNNGLTSIVESSIVERDFSKEKSSFKSEEAEEDLVVEETDDDGNPLVNNFGRKKGAPKTEKNKDALALVYAFYDMAEKTTGVRPPELKADYFVTLAAIGKLGLTKEKVIDLYEWWFGRNDVGNKIIGSLTACLSPKNINFYKLENQ